MVTRLRSDLEYSRSLRSLCILNLRLPPSLVSYIVVRNISDVALFRLRPPLVQRCAHFVALSPLSLRLPTVVASAWSSLRFALRCALRLPFACRTLAELGPCFAARRFAPCVGLVRCRSQASVA